YIDHRRGDESIWARCLIMPPHMSRHSRHLRQFVEFPPPLPARNSRVTAQGAKKHYKLTHSLMYWKSLWSDEDRPVAGRMAACGFKILPNSPERSCRMRQPMFMGRSFHQGRKSGFTLVEILIVVIILGILAAIVIPQFTNASTDARRASLVSQLQTLRSQIQLFKLQHNDILPDLVANQWAQMMSKTDLTGAVNTAAAGLFGPYLES